MNGFVLGLGIGLVFCVWVACGFLAGAWWVDGRYKDLGPHAAICYPAGTTVR